MALTKHGSTSTVATSASWEVRQDFANVATWETGDPPFDFDGDLRPTTDDTSDYAGADIP